MFGIREVLFGALWALPSSGVLAQLAAPPPAFEAATVRTSTAADAALNPPTGEFKNGRLILTNATMRMLIDAAYRGGVDMDHIAGGPNWLDADRFDISAKADPTTTEESSRLMLGTLLAERFDLRFHHENRMMPVFALVVAKKGPQLQPTAPGLPAWSGCRGRPLDCRHISMSELAKFLPHADKVAVYTEVVDQTGLDGRFDFKLAFTPASPSGTGDVAAGPSLLEALDQLGLKLEPKRLPVDYMVIDHVNRSPVEK